MREISEADLKDLVEFWGNYIGSQPYTAERAALRLAKRITELEQQLRDKYLESLQWQNRADKSDERVEGLLVKCQSLEQQLADKSFYAKESADGFDQEVRRANKLQRKLTERDKLLDECERWLEWFVCNGPKPTLEINSINLLSAIKERKHD